MGNQKAKNGTIEFLRFVFCMAIIMFHLKYALGIKLPEPFTFFSKGRLGVEFFFLVSGYLLANTALTKRKESSLVKSTTAFMSRKIFGVLNYHIVLFFICLVLLLIFTPLSGAGERIKFTVQTLPNLFFLQRSGLIGVEPNSPEWYVAAMLVMMLPLYPLVYRYKERFTKIAAPLLMILLIGYIFHTDGKFGGTDKWMFGGVFPKVYLRAFADMTAGTFCYEVSKKLKTLNFTRLDRAVLTFIEFLCYALPLVYSCSNWETAFEGYAFYSLMAGVTLSFSEVTLTSEMMKNRLSYFLGKLSLPLYFSQSAGLIILYLHVLPEDMQIRYKALISLAVMALTTAVAIPLAKGFERLYNSKIEKLTGQS